MSFLPAAGTRQTHFAIAAVTLRIFAAVYASVIALDAIHAISSRARRGLDVASAAVLALMSWAETYPAGNHLTEIGIYAGVSLILFALTLLSLPAGARIASPSADAV